MLCQHCNEKEATNHYKRVINGHKEEAYLCAGCAHALGYDRMMEEMSLGFGMGLGSMLGNFLSATSSVNKALAGVERCPQCGASFNDIVSWGMVGCGDCYNQFRDRLMPSIENLHGHAVHNGKAAKQATIKVKEELSEKEKLERAMNAAVERQDFELAAELRDKIHALEKPETEKNQGGEAGESTSQE